MTRPHLNSAGLRIRRRISEVLLLRQHALVQDARDENALFLATVEEHMPVSFKAKQAGANPLAKPTEQRITGEQLGAAFEAVEVTLCLSRAPGLKSVCANVQQVCLGIA